MLVAPKIRPAWIAGWSHLGPWQAAHVRRIQAQASMKARQAAHRARQVQRIEALAQQGQEREEQPEAQARLAPA